MNYGIYTEYKSTKCFCSLSILFSEKYKYFQKLESVLVFWVCFVQQIVILNIVFGFCVFNSLWEHWLNLFLNIFRKYSNKKTVPEV